VALALPCDIEVYNYVPHTNIHGTLKQVSYIYRCRFKLKLSLFLSNTCYRSKGELKVKLQAFSNSARYETENSVSRFALFATGERLFLYLFE
jgi:hypothetical protein